VAACTHGPRIADALFERRARRDALALHLGSVAAVEALRQVDEWPCEHVAVALTGAVEAIHGDVERMFAWASVTKLATAVAALVAAEEGLVDLDEPAGPPGSTFRHLLAHASGLPFDHGAPIARPGARRVYSNFGFDVAAAHVEERAEMPFDEYYAAVWQGTGAVLEGSAGSGVTGTIGDLAALARELQRPERIAGETLDEARSVQFPGLAGVLPGFGRQEPNDWGLGLELRDGKSPHWTGARNAPTTYGHFGRSGTFLWVDPVAGIALACLTDLPFGDWARDAWPRLSDAVLSELKSSP
jgi:CubicO group peptidase (beta-lactamase class C family)